MKGRPRQRDAYSAHEQMPSAKRVHRISPDFRMAKPWRSTTVRTFHGMMPRLVGDGSPFARVTDTTLRDRVPPVGGWNTRCLCGSAVGIPTCRDTPHWRRTFHPKSAVVAGALRHGSTRGCFPGMSSGRHRSPPPLSRLRAEGVRAQRRHDGKEQAAVERVWEMRAWSPSPRLGRGTG